MCAVDLDGEASPFHIFCLREMRTGSVARLPCFLRDLRSNGFSRAHRCACWGNQHLLSLTTPATGAEHRPYSQPICQQGGAEALLPFPMWKDLPCRPVSGPQALACLLWEPFFFPVPHLLLSWCLPVTCHLSALWGQILTLRDRVSIELPGISP